MSVIDYSIFYNYAPPYANKGEPDFVCFFFYPLFTGMKKGNRKYRVALFLTFSSFKNTFYSLSRTFLISAFICKLSFFVSEVFFFSPISHLYLLSPQRKTHGDFSSHAFLRGIYDIRKLSTCFSTIS